MAKKNSDETVYRLRRDEEQEGNDTGASHRRAGHHSGCDRQKEWQRCIHMP